MGTSFVASFTIETGGQNCHVMWILLTNQQAAWWCNALQLPSEKMLWNPSIPRPHVCALDHTWLQGRGRHYVSHNAPCWVYKTLQLLFPPERGLLRMTHHYINKGWNRSRLFIRERVELLIELSKRWLRTNISNTAPPTGTILFFKLILEHSSKENGSRQNESTV